MKESNYVKMRDEFINGVLSLTKAVYPKDNEMLFGVIGLTTKLRMAEQRDVFILDLCAFIKWSNIKKEKPSTVLTTKIHDLSEFAKNRNQDWFCPRTFGYTKHLKQIEDQAGVAIK